MNIPTYQPDEMERLELLAYQNPEGLHPVEAAWRDLARKLLQHTKVLQEKVKEGRTSKYRFDQVFEGWSECKFPEPVTPLQPNE